MSKKLALLSLLGGAVTGVVIIVLAELLGFPPFAGLLVYVVPTVAWLVYCKLYVPRRFPHMLHKQLNRVADPATAPPTGSVPADSDVIRRLFAAREWEGKHLLLAKDFTIVDVKGRRLKRPMYSGPPIDTASWERYVLTPDGTMVREISCTGVVSVV